MGCDCQTKTHTIDGQDVMLYLYDTGAVLFINSKLQKYKNDALQMAPRNPVAPQRVGKAYRSRYKRHENIQILVGGSEY